MTAEAEDQQETGTGAGPFFFQRRFFPMWSAFVLGAFTDNMLRQALLIGLTYGTLGLPGVTDSARIVPYAATLFALAMLVFSPIAGQFADKFETRRLFRITKFAEFLLMALAALGFLIMLTPLHALAGPALVVLMFLMGIQSAFFSPVRIAAMPKYLHADELIRANAFCNGGLYVAIMLGMLLGGGLVALAHGPYTVGPILFVASLAGWLIIRLAPEAGADAPELKLDWNILTQFRSQARHVLAEPAVIHPMLGLGLFFFISTAVTVGVPVYAKDTLNADGTVATAITGLFAIGVLIGAVLSALLSKRRTGLGFANAAMIIAALSTAGLYFASDNFAHPGAAAGVGEFFARPRGWLLSGLFIACSAAMGVYTVPLQAAVQRRARPQHRARIMAAGNMLNALTAILGSLSVASVTGTNLAPHQAFLGIALLQGIIAAYMIWRRRSVPEGMYDGALEDAAQEPAHPQDVEK